MLMFHGGNGHDLESSASPNLLYLQKHILVDSQRAPSMDHSWLDHK
jgi:hypothetical protein